MALSLKKVTLNVGGQTNIYQTSVDLQPSRIQYPVGHNLGGQDHPDAPDGGFGSAHYR